LQLLTPAPDTDITANEKLLKKELPGIITHYYQPGPRQAGRYEMYKTAAKALATGGAYWSMIWFNRSLRDAVQRLQTQECFDAVHCEWLQPALSLTGLDLPLVIRTLDVHFEGMKQWAEKIPDSERIRKLFWRKQAQRFRSYETQVLAAAAAVVTLSAEDEATLRKEGLATVVTVPPPRMVEEEASGQSNSTCLVLFVGRLDMEVNRDAFFVFANEIWPTVSPQARQLARVVFAGGFPADEMRQRAREIGVELRAPLADDEASELFRSADIFLSPVRTGTGIKIKTLEAMAHGKPMIGFSGAFRGVPVESNKHALIADTPADFARLFEALLLDQTMQRRIGAAAREFVRLHFDPQYLGARLIQVYESVAETYAQKQPNKLNGCPGPLANNPN
jgi:glycosyltransferase involved in cell wall biosynthesis